MRETRRLIDLNQLVRAARDLRARQTPAEAILWSLLRGRKLFGLKFRRQHRIGTFIVDFYCPERNLVIELDGGIHSAPEQQQKDQNRDAYLKSQGILVLRFNNQQVLEYPEEVLEQIAGKVFKRWRE